MRFACAPDTVDQRTEMFWGLALVNADAAAALAFPDADVEGDNIRWLVRDFALNRMSNINDNSQVVMRTYDLRAQALFRSDQEELHLVVDQGAGGGAVFHVMTRILLRVP